MLLSDDSFTGLVVHFVVISPILSWILQSKKYSKKTSIYFAIAFLVALCAISIGYELHERKANFYEILDVTRSSSLKELKRAYRSQSIALHPDKNPSPTAQDDFARLRVAFDVLSDSAKRKIYDHFGEEEALQKDPSEAVTQLTNIFVYYMVWALTMYLMTLGNSKNNNSRSWIYVGGLMMFLIEVKVQFSNFQLSPVFFPKRTPYELIKLMHIILPLYGNSCRTLGYHLVDDSELEAQKLQVLLLKSNKNILLGLREIQINLENNAPKLAKSKSKFSRHKNAAPPAEEGPVNQYEEEREVAKPSGDVESPFSFNIPSFVYYIALYLVWNYFS